MKNDYSKNLSERLKKYALAAGAVAAAGSGEAAIVYTDINPDFAGAIGSSYLLDLNNDSVNDFSIYHNGGSNLFISPLVSGASVIGTGTAGSFAYPYALSSNDMISASASGTWFSNGYSTGYQSLNYGSCSFGNWCTVTDKYLGLRIEVGPNTYYGWARLDVNASGSVWSVKDYAYEDTPGVGILAGSTVSPISASGATNVTAADVANNSNGDDLEVMFNAGLNENSIDEYRVMAVQASNAAGFTLPVAQAVTSGNYTAIAPSGAFNYTQVLGALANDASGSPIENGQPYRVFVLSAADISVAQLDSLSLPSDSVTLYVPANPASNVVAADVDNNGNGSDMEISFDAAASEATVDEYRLMVVKDVNAGSFDLATAQAVAFGNYQTESPTGASSYSQTLPFSATDVDGDPLAMGESYRVFILAAADGMNTITDTLSTPSSVVILQLPSSPAENIIGTDVDDSNNGTDLDVTFDAAAAEDRVGEYRIMVVKTGNAGTFNIASAQAVTSANYTVVSPNGSASYSQLLDAAANDVDGDPIAVNIGYNIFVMSQADGVIAAFDTLSQPSPNAVLNIQVNAATNVAGADTDNNLDASDAEISFDAGSDEFQISDYRVLIVKNGASFNPIDAITVPAANYTSVSADGSPSYAISLASGATDVDGDAIAQSSLYRAYILSVANGTDANIDSLSAPSEAFKLDNTIGIDDQSRLDLQVFSTGKRIRIEGLTSGSQADLTVMNVNGQAILQSQSPESALWLDLEAFANGIYILRIEEGGKSFIQRVSIQ